MKPSFLFKTRLFTLMLSMYKSIWTVLQSKLDNKFGLQLRAKLYTQKARFMKIPTCICALTFHLQNTTFSYKAMLDSEKRPISLHLRLNSEPALTWWSGQTEQTVRQLTMFTTILDTWYCIQKLLHSSSIPNLSCSRNIIIMRMCSRKTR